MPGTVLGAQVSAVNKTKPKSVLSWSLHSRREKTGNKSIKSDDVKCCGESKAANGDRKSAYGVEGVVSFK